MRELYAEVLPAHAVAFPMALGAYRLDISGMAVTEMMVVVRSGPRAVGAT
jgi:hypothetical protein